MKKEELNKILNLHKTWVNGEKGGKYADLSNADLSNADLRYANLRGANLRGANLRGANLRYCVGNGKEIKSLQIGTYLISYTKDILNIGCQSHTLDEWKSFTDDEISEMDSDVLEWWKLNKYIVIELAERERNEEKIKWKK